MSLVAKLNNNWKNNSDDIRDSIIENICSLISSRAPVWPESADLSQFDGTIATLGLQNVARSQSKANSEVVLQDITQVIRKFEPRLSQVELELAEESIKQNRLQFRISAVMNTSQGSEAIVLDSFLDFGSSKLDIRKSNLV
ncbi:type VI secretion system baseplate subunit TssE [Vibrio sp. SCSIO 43137]|uniref:type VI secretion system baseplate subunit TssE n=1 Tax=Vibrio sp. SCSIO 43137 TaxID=3021011 RepID=UPI00230762E9|nr:type VI secretion system baseplate subunit TssE [Vibrio sp. SCSIO 43137]WCE31022.1 type VI secretion system baseplate subunit TssE [Vibrio sp. SCSIO 43137]